MSLEKDQQIIGQRDLWTRFSLLMEWKHNVSVPESASTAPIKSSILVVDPPEVLAFGDSADWDFVT